MAKHAERLKDVIANEIAIIKDSDSTPEEKHYFIKKLQPVLSTVERAHRHYNTDWETLPFNKPKGWPHTLSILGYKNFGFETFDSGDARHFGECLEEKIREDEEERNLDYKYPITMDEFWYYNAFKKGILRRKPIPLHTRPSYFFSYPKDRVQMLNLGRILDEKRVIREMPKTVIKTLIEKDAIFPSGEWLCRTEISGSSYSPKYRSYLLVYDKLTDIGIIERRENRPIEHRIKNLVFANELLA